MGLFMQLLVSLTLLVASVVIAALLGLLVVLQDLLVTDWHPPVSILDTPLEHDGDGARALLSEPPARYGSEESACQRPLPSLPS